MDKLETKISRSRLIEIILFVIIITQMGIIFYVNLTHYNYNLNADIASEGLLARLIWESGEWIPSTWYVAEETRVFDVANLAALFYGMTMNMQLSVGISCCVMTVGIILSAWYFVSGLSLERIQKEIFILLCLILPNNLMILELFYLFASYYSPHIIVLFITLGVYARTLEHKMNWRYFIITLVLHFMLGVQGVRGILVIAGPVFAVEIVRTIYLYYKKEKYTIEDVKITLWSFLLIITGFMGGIFPFSVGEELSRNIRRAPEKFVNSIVPHILKSLGFQDAKNMIEKVILLIFITILVLVVVMVLYKGIRKKELGARAWTYLVLVGSPIATAVIATFTTVESSDRYYFVFIIAMALAVALLWNSEEKGITALCTLLIVGIVIVNFAKVYKPILQSVDLINDSRYHVVQYLEENEYKRAYTNFDNANTMTSMCNGRVQVSPVASFEKIDVCKWMSSMDWYCPNVPFEEKTAYIVSEYFLGDFEKFQEKHQNEIEFETKIGQYYIYGSEYNYSVLE